MQYSNGEQECAGGVVDSCLDRMFEETYVKEVKNPSLLHVGGGSMSSPLCTRDAVRTRLLADSISKQNAGMHPPLQMPIRR